MTLPVGIPPSRSRINLLNQLGSGMISQGMSGQARTPLAALGNIAQTFAGTLLANRAQEQQQARTQAGNEALMNLFRQQQPNPAAFAGGPPSVSSAQSQAQLAALAPRQPTIQDFLAVQQQFPEMANTLSPFIAQQLQAPAQQKMFEVDGRVFDPNTRQFVTPAPAPEPRQPLSPIGKMVEDLEAAESDFGQDSPQAKAIREAIRSETQQEPRTVDLGDEGSVRKEFTKQSGEFLKVRDAYKRILASKPSAAGDLALIFNYMKILDPGSTVREGEFANAQNSAGVPDRVRAFYNNTMRGERLTEGQRADFMGQAGALYNTQKESQDALEGTFRGLAERSGLRPENVVVDFQGDLRDFSPEPATAEPETGGAQAAEPLPRTGGRGGGRVDWSGFDDGAFRQLLPRLSGQDLDDWEAEAKRRGLL